MALEVTVQRAEEFGIAGKGEDEGVSAFRHRVAGALREMGHIIEAHEAQTDRLYNDPGNGLLDDPMTGIIGAVAQVTGGIDYGSSDGIQQVGDDMAVGTVVRLPEEKMNPDVTMLMLALMGGNRK